MADPADLSFLAPPGEVWDWRMTLLYDAAREAGLLAALPGGAPDLAGPLGLDEHAVRVVLDALTAWGVVSRSGDTYRTGPAAPSPDEASTLELHARSMRRWAAGVDDRLRGVAPSPDATGMRPQWLEALAVNARRVAPGLVDGVLARFPGARRVLDLGGGHGEHALEFARRGLEATVQDRPVVVEHARAQGRLGAGGVALFAGDFHETLAGGPFDLVFCSGVTHTMSGERNQDLYRRLVGVLAPGGALVISTFLRHRGPIVAVFAVQMLMGAQGGDTFAEEQYRSWLAAAGFTAVDVTEVSPSQSLLVATLA